MKINYTWMTLACLVLSAPLAWVMLHRRSARVPVDVVRVASFNVSLHRGKPGELLADLRSGRCEQAKKLAAIVQQSEVDVLFLCEIDRDAEAAALDAFADLYLAEGQDGRRGIEFPYRYCAEVNTGEPSGLDLDGDGKSDGPADAWGFGRFPGQYGMAVLSRHPILVDRVRTFRELPWSAMPDAMRPEGFYPDDVWKKLRLSSKSHWDVPIGIGPVEEAHVVHLLCSHPTPPAFDGPEDRNGCRNHDEIRFWVDYLTPGRSGWIVDDAGRRGGLSEGEAFVVLGDLNCDPIDGESRHDAMVDLLRHPRLIDPEPSSQGAIDATTSQWGVNARHRGPAERDTSDFGDVPGTGPGNLRVDYALPSRELRVYGAGVFWPMPGRPGGDLVGASDHRLVWVDVSVR